MRTLQRQDSRAMTMPHVEGCLENTPVDTLDSNWGRTLGLSLISFEGSKQLLLIPSISVAF